MGAHFEALIEGESFGMGLRLICLLFSIKIPFEPAFGSGLDSGWPQRDVGANLRIYQVQAPQWYVDPCSEVLGLDLQEKKLNPT